MGTICVCRGEESSAIRVSCAKWGEDDKFVFIYSKQKKSGLIKLAQPELEWVAGLFGSGQ